jgi:hypothetical protein
MRYDKPIIELILLLLAFLGLWIFTPDILPILKDAETSDINKPAQSLFLFFRYILELFTNITATIVLYLIGGGIIILHGRRS